MKKVKEKGFVTVTDVKKSSNKKSYWSLFQRKFGSIIESFRSKPKYIKNEGCCNNLCSCNKSNDVDVDINVIKKRGKIVTEPIKVDDETFFLEVSINGIDNTIIISMDNDLEECGNIIYEVKSKNGGDSWYVYSKVEEIITRHRAIYYVWKVLEAITPNIKYHELRSTKKKIEA